MIRLVNFPNEKDLELGEEVEHNLEDQQEEREILEKFIVPLPIFDRIEKVAHPSLEIMEKKVIAFATQYGPNNQNTTKMLYNYLETIKEVGCQKLQKKQHQASIYFFSKCMGFTEPPEAYVYKFLQSKVDVVNKLMHVLLTFKKNEKSNIEMGYQFIQSYIHELEKSNQLQKLLHDLKSNLEFNYFFAGKFSQKSKNDPLAIKFYEKCVGVINNKMAKLAQSKPGTLDNMTAIEDKLLNLKIKSYYNISKSNRLLNEKQQQKYEILAINESKGKKYDLYIYISRKIREFREKRNFKEVLSGLQSRKKIQNEVFRLIQQSKKKEHSLYSFYEHEDEEEK